MVELSAATWNIVQKLFLPEYQQEVGQLLEYECGNNLPFCENSDKEDLERIRFAVLKMSKGDIDKLRRVIKLAQEDWRDVLMGAGFENSVTAHQDWEKKLSDGV